MKGWLRGRGESQFAPRGRRDRGGQHRQGRCDQDHACLHRPNREVATTDVRASEAHGIAAAQTGVEQKAEGGALPSAERLARPGASPCPTGTYPTTDPWRVVSRTRWGGHGRGMVPVIGSPAGGPRQAARAARRSCRVVARSSPLPRRRDAQRRRTGSPTTWTAPMARATSAWVMAGGTASDSRSPSGLSTGGSIQKSWNVFRIEP